MTEHKKAPPIAEHCGGGNRINAPVNGGIIAHATIYPQGLRLRKRGRVLAAKYIPDNLRKEGDIQGWSADSRRRFREFLLRHEPLPGLCTFEATLTIPPYPVGHPSPCIDLEGARRLWKRWQVWLNDSGIGALWRLEVQPRNATKRDDIRGIPQPHWHLIGAAPTAPAQTELARADADAAAAVCGSIAGHWCAFLGDRICRAGQCDRAAICTPTASYSEARTRYLFDHSSKAKRAQVASGWGRHWGVIGRHLWQPSQCSSVDLTERQWIEAGRLLRRLHRRRVPDRRSAGGLDLSWWHSSPAAEGHRLTYAGGSVVIPGWDGVTLSQAAKRAAVAHEGQQRRNTWGLRLSPHYRHSIAGQWFGASGPAAVLGWILRQSAT